MQSMSKNRVFTWVTAALGVCAVSLAMMPLAEAQPMRRQGMQQGDGNAPGGMHGGGQGGGGQGGGQAGQGGMPREEGAGPRARGEVPRWIDTHVHLVSGATNTTGDWAGAVQVALADMDKNDIGIAIVMPTPQPPGNNLYDIADFVDAIKKHPTRFAFLGGGGTLNPMILQDPDAETVSEATRKKFTDIANGILDAGATGFGEMAATHLSLNESHAYHRARPDHPLFLLLAEIAAKRNAVIDIHMDLVIEPMPTQPRLRDMSQRNPASLVPNLAQFEKLLAHDRGARIIWAHAGIDHTGELNVDVIRRMMQQHPNLYMSLKTMPQSPQPNAPLAGESRLKPEWRRLIAEFPDRFVIGTDRFYGSSAMGLRAGSGGNQRASAGNIFLERTVPLTQGARHLLSQLPPQLAQKVAVDNVKTVYRLP